MKLKNKQEVLKLYGILKSRLYQIEALSSKIDLESTGDPDVPELMGLVNDLSTEAGRVTTKLGKQLNITVA